MSLRSDFGRDLNGAMMNKGGYTNAINGYSSTAEWKATQPLT